MEKKNNRKQLVILIIILFIGAGVASLIVNPRHFPPFIDFDLLPAREPYCFNDLCSTEQKQ
ncbi:MAG: hypothetical protein NTV74_06920 [Euryarchaeota archaeon]|nr:hypothetical protein [Euryarchaeota archaeon]